ncbi:MAG: outer membrane protein assembly factor BamA [Bdellovibrionales bacterium]|nr:outer membrane protein assembly factor BamA [Bdellovibrionales bacterium]
MIRLRRGFVHFCLLVGLLACGLGATSALALPIKTIVIEGNRRIEADAIREKMHLKVGNEASPEAVRADLSAIFGLGFFEDGRVEQDDDGTLHVIVRERPVVTEIKYEGSDEFEAKDLEEASGLKAFNVVNLSKIRAAQTAITKKYEDKGYYLARAPYLLEPIADKPNEVRLVFKIQENEKVRVRKIFFLGNKVFSSDDIREGSHMSTTEGHAFSWATGGGTYREAFFDRDLNNLAYFYGKYGYIEAKFAKPRVTLSEDRRYVDIFIDVDEGKQFFLGNVTFKGDLIFTQEDLRSSFGMKEGEVFSLETLREQILKLTDKYGDEGYAFANVVPKTQIREGTQIVDLNFDIEKGEKVYWGKISVSGNTKTHDKVVRRELPFYEGELYNATKRNKGLERIKRLGFFGDVSFLTSTPPGSNNTLNLEVRVAEKQTGSLQVSAGWSTAQGFVVGGQITQANLFGLGQQLSFSLNWASTSKTFDLSFTDPRIFDSEWLFGFDLYLRENAVGYSPITYNQKVYGSDVRLGREIYENLSLFGTYKIERSLLSNPINESVYTSPGEKDSLVSSITSTIAYDTRNNRLDPSGGEYLSASGEFAGLGGRVFQKYSAEAKMYRRLFWNFVYRTRAEYSLLTNNMNGDPVPDTERFVLGGPFSLRGYGPGSVGPSKTVLNTRDQTPGQLGAPATVTIGGTQKFVYVNEVEFPLIAEANIRMVFFFDAGNTWDSFSAASPAFLSDVGWGIRWYSPLGPLRFEWGYPLRVLPNSPDSPYFNFIIAPSF